MRAGYNPPNRYTTKRGTPGSLRFHAFGCRVSGGPGLPPGACAKCAEGETHAREMALLRKADSLRRVRE